MNRIPDKIYVKVVYEIKEEGKSGEKKSFTYQCDVINVDELNFDKFDSTTIDDSKNIVLNGIDEVLKTKVRTELKESTSESDTYRLNITYNPLQDDKKVVESAAIALFLGIKNTESDKDNYFEDYSKPLTGFCRIRWAKKKEFLKELGYDWKSPEDLFPFVHFD